MSVISKYSQCADLPPYEFAATSREPLKWDEAVYTWESYANNEPLRIDYYMGGVLQFSHIYTYVGGELTNFKVE